jgi:hypothetical protein
MVTGILATGVVDVVPEDGGMELNITSVLTELNGDGSKPTIPLEDKNSNGLVDVSNPKAYLSKYFFYVMS